MLQQRAAAVRSVAGGGGGDGAAASRKRAPASTDMKDVLIEGPLKKKNTKSLLRFAQEYRTRYFVLSPSDAALHYFESKAKRRMNVGGRSIRFLDMFKVVVHMDARGRVTKRFAIRVTTGRSFELEGKNLKDSEEWVRAPTLPPRARARTRGFFCVCVWAGGWVGVSVLSVCVCPSRSPAWGFPAYRRPFVPRRRCCATLTPSRSTDD